MTTKLRMLLKDANVDPGLIEISSEGKVNPVTGEPIIEHIRGLLSISLTFVTSGDQGTSTFDEVDEWVKDYFKRAMQGAYSLLDVTIEEVARG